MENENSREPNVKLAGTDGELDAPDPTSVPSGGTSTDIGSTSTSDGHDVPSGPSEGTPQLPEVNIETILANLDVTPGNFENSLQSIQAIISYMSSMSPTSKLPSTTIPRYSLKESPSEISSQDIEQPAANLMEDVGNEAAKAFRVVDLAKMYLEKPQVPEAPSEPSTSNHFSAVSDSLSGLGSFMNDVSDILGRKSTSREVSRAMQGNKLFLFAAIAQLNLTLQAMPESSPNYPLLQSTLGFVLLCSYELTHDRNELDAAIEATILPLRALGSDAFPATATFIVRSWAYSQRLLSRATHDIDPLHLVISVGTTTYTVSTQTYPGDQELRRLLATELADCHLERYYAVGMVEDVTAALELMKSAYTDDELDDSRTRCVLAQLYLELFKRVGKLEDLDRALHHAMHLHEFHNDSSAYLPSPVAPAVHPDAARARLVMAETRAERYTVVMDIDDLDRAMTYSRQALQLAPRDHPLHSLYLVNLASNLYQRHVADDDIADLDACINELRGAIDIPASCSYVHYPLRAILGLALARHGARTKSATEIQEGIQHLTIARKAFSGGAHLEARIERDMASALMIRFELTGTQEDLDDAIRYASSALERAPSDDRSRDELARQLGGMLARRYTHTQNEADLERAVATLREVATGGGSASVRLQAAVDWAKATSSRGPASTLAALEVALDVIPLVTWSGHRMVVQYKALVSLSTDVGPWAAACAIATGKLEEALSYLERGRSVLWAQSLKLQPGARRHRLHTAHASDDRTWEHDALSAYLSTTTHGFPKLTAEHHEYAAKQHPQLHAIGENLRSILEDLKMKARAHPYHRAGDFERMDAFRSTFMDIYQEASLHSAASRLDSLHRMMEELKQDDISLPRSPTNNAYLADLLTSGRIVFLNAHRYRCDALILSLGGDGNVEIGNVPLPELSVEDALGWAEAIQIGMGDLQQGVLRVRDFEEIILVPILQGLWNVAIGPILAHLLIDESCHSSPPRIWWCPTGPLASLPIHAAGPYEDGALGTPDLVVSSYISTLDSLVRAYLTSKQDSPGPCSMLAIGQPETPGLAPLPAVHKEMSTVTRACSTIAHTPQTLLGPEATAFLVSRELSKHTWLHISCHAHQDPNYAFDSAFYMYNGPLTLGALMQLDLTHVQFAFLSACLTSAGDARLLDECIHLAAGLQFAGVKSAVATLWSVDERAAAFVTERVYEKLFREGVVQPDARESADALHTAVSAMRAAGRRMVFWVPFIHVGL